VSTVQQQLACLHHEQRGRFPDEWTHHYRQSSVRPYDHLVYSPYFPRSHCTMHGWHASKNIGLDGRRRCRRAPQRQVQTKVDILGGLTARPPAVRGLTIIGDHRRDRMIASCIHHISHDPTAGRAGGTHQRTLGWTGGGGVGVRRSDRCKPKWTYWVV